MTVELHKDYLSPIPGNEVRVIDSAQSDWSQQVDVLRQELGSPDNPTLFPPHFLKKTLPSIGGVIMTIRHDDRTAGAVFLFPRVMGDSIGYTARLHIKNPIQGESVKDLIQAKVGLTHPITVYEPMSVVSDVAKDVVYETPIHRSQDSDGQRIRSLQKDIWGAGDDFLYPEDIHTSAFGLPTSLIAYDNGAPVGFVFGFDKYSSEPQPASLRGLISNWHIRQESQLAGVLPEFRGRGIANALKRKQRESVIERGTEVINWTFDPLLSENSVLNLNKLGGVVSEHHPNYYAFAGANKLNQVVASRFSVTWFTNSPRVANNIEGSTKVRSEKAKEGIMTRAIPVITTTYPYETEGDSSPKRAVNEKYIADADTEAIAIEIPTNWTAIQSSDVPLATDWRNTTDAIFHAYLGTGQDQYVLTDTVIMEGRAFLIGQSAQYLERIFLGRDRFSSTK